MHVPFQANFPQYNNCGPISQLSKYVEIMLFDVVFIEKNAKDKNTALRKISYVISSQWEHFGAWFKLIWVTTVKSYNFCLFLFLEIGHVTYLPTTHGMDLNTQNHHDIVSPNFLVIHFFLIFWLQCLSYHIWKYAQTM